MLFFHSSPFFFPFSHFFFLFCFCFLFLFLYHFIISIFFVFLFQFFPFFSLFRCVFPFLYLDLAIISLLSPPSLLLYLGLGPARFLWRVKINPGGVVGIILVQSLVLDGRRVSLREEPRLGELVNNIIHHFLDVDSAVAMVVFTRYFIVSFFHVEAKCVLK